ncbi:MAG TPA: NAD-dependent epimerase/dehydratase family protein [Mycobacteriales bacterium]|nr:NAD-dependent epimerase/dehydratase family protein [Mycobacteriales bacterium]
MKVLITGGTGFIGSHITRAALRNGHAVRLLVRDEAKAQAIYRRHDIEIADLCVGDMRDADAVAAAVSGCDAVVHAAAEIAVAGGAGPTSATANLDGATTVITAAIAAGCDPIVYTSSVTAYLPTTAAMLTESSPLAEPRSAYAASKRDVELFIRHHQEAGAPVVSVALGGVYGPEGPGLDGAAVAISSALNVLMLVPPGGLGVIDVRDTAELFVRLLEPGRGPRRIMAGGNFVTWREWADVLQRARGQPVQCQEMSLDDILELGREFDRQRAAGQDVPPLSEEAALLMTAGVPSDDTTARQVLGRDYRPILETFRDTVDWLRQQGHVS